jgi:hypothetical protein
MAGGSHDHLQRRLSLRLGLINGCSIGLALALGIWIPDVIGLILNPVQGAWPVLILGVLAVVGLCSLGGWLAAHTERAAVGMLIWAVVGGLAVWVGGHLPYEGRTLIAWLADRRFIGLPIYPFSAVAQYYMIMAGFFAVLLLGMLGLLQDYRLEGLRAEVGRDGRLTGRVWFSLLLPLPFVIGVGLIADNLVNAPLRAAPRQVHEAIRTGRTYQGDLFELSQRSAVNYNAIRGVRDQMSADYVLSVGEADLGAAKTIFMVAHFDNGAWINCQVINEQLSNCWDASLPFEQGLPAFLTTGEMPEDCLPCRFKVGDQPRDWLQTRRVHWTDPPQVTRLAQWGSYVLVGVRSSGDGYGIECLFHGFNPVELDRCWETVTRS